MNNKTSSQPLPGLVKQLLKLRKQLQQVGNNPHAYRSKAFAEWHREALQFYQYVECFDADPQLEVAFQQRAFGRTRELLVEQQIFQRFKQDVETTLIEFEQLHSRYQAMGKIKAPSLGLKWRLFWRRLRSK